MKKLIVMFAAAAIATASQAAAFKWTTDAVPYGVNAAAVTDNGDYAAGTTVMKNQGTWTFVLSLYDQATGDLVGSSASTSVKFSSTNQKVNTANISVAAGQASTTYDYVLTITGTETSLTSRGEDTAAGFNYSGATLTTTLSGSVATASAGASNLQTGLPTTWTISGITALSPTPGPTPGPDPLPEPTSGLLLLVGAGMLALRRKQK